MNRLEIDGINLEQFEAIIERIVEDKVNNLKKDFEPKTPEELLSRHEVAALLKIDISSVHNWTNKGRLTSYGISGGRVYYKRSEIEAALIRITK